MQKKSTFGSLIDLIVHSARNSADKKVTEFIEQITINSRLSSRQVNRMRDYSGYPEDKSIIKLMEVLPDIDLLDPTTIPSRILLPWSGVQRDQAKLPANTSIIIASGWQPPKATFKENIAKSIAINISKGFSYTFVYPHPDTYKGENADEMTNKWIENVRRKVSLAWENHIAWEQEQENDSVGVKLSIEKEVKDHIGFINTKKQGDFWFKLPAPYCVFYNLGLIDRDPNSRHGVFNIQGLLIADITKQNPERNDALSEGWLLTSEEQFKDIERSFITDTEIQERDRYVRKTV